MKTNYSNTLLFTAILLLLFSGCSHVFQEKKLVTFLSSDHRGGNLLMVAFANGEGKGMLIPWLGDTREFSWLPDGSGLYAWMVEAPGGKPYNFILTYLDGRPAICVTCAWENYYGWPIPSPDSQWFAIEVDVKVNTTLSKTLLYKVRNDGSEFILLVDVEEMVINGQPSWSPNGEYLVFPAYVSGIGQDIYRVKSDGSDLINLTENHRDITDYPTEFFSPQWSPSGDMIAFLASGSRSSIWVMDIDGTNLVELSHGGAPLYEVWDPASDLPPQWSPDGSMLAFSTHITDISQGLDIFVINSDGTGLRNITNAPEDDFNPVWSPDGKQIAFVKRSEEDLWDWEVYVINVDGSNLINVSQSPDTRDYFPVWRP